MSLLLQDLRRTLSGFRQRRLISLFVVLSLGLGIAGNTASFSLVSAWNTQADAASRAANDAWPRPVGLSRGPRFVRESATPTPPRPSDARAW